MDPHHSSMALQTLALSIVAGVGLVILSQKLRVSAIVLLLIGGVLLGPEVFGIIRPAQLGENVLRSMIALAVGLILFEGGLTLNIAGYRTASVVIKRLLSVGALVTWGGTTLIIWLLFGDRFGDSAFRMALLAGSLVIVTGPTVIAPLLRRLKVRQNLHDILHWESVLIDPIGVFIALLTYEWIMGASAQQALVYFVERFAAGLFVGVAGGLLADWLIRRRHIPEEQTNIFVVAIGLLVFAVSDLIIQDAGLLGATVAGLVLGWRRPGPLRDVKERKAEITDLLIGTLFILLTAQLRFEDFRDFGLAGVLAVAGVILVVRPLNIFLCSMGSRLDWREKLFLCWIAPRGIVAASMSSLFAFKLADIHSPFLVTFTYSVIASTVLIQGFTAPFVAKLLEVRLPPPTGWLIVGAHPMGRRIARFIRDRAKLPCVLVDANRKAIAEAKAEKLTAVEADARDPSLADREELRTVGNVLALTDNEELNVIICQRWLSTVGRTNTYRWSSGKTPGDESHSAPGIIVFKSLPKPSLLASEIARGEAALYPAMHKAGAPLENTPVVFVASGAVTLDPTAGSREDRLKGGGEVLLLRREADTLQRSLLTQLVMRLDGTVTRDNLFREMVVRMTQAEPLIAKEETITELIEREKSFPTALGHRIALPHAYSGTLNRRLCAVALVPGGVDFDAPDGEPVNLVFLLISPKGDPEGHLAAIAEVARVVADKARRELLLAATDPADVYRLLTGSVR